MTNRSPRIDRAAFGLLSTVAGTSGARVSALALGHKRGVGERLIDAGLLVPQGGGVAVAVEDDLDDALTSVVPHPITGRLGWLGKEVWEDELSSAKRRIYALNMRAIARRVTARLACSLDDDPVPYLDGAVLDFGTARLPKRRARVGIWVARGMTVPAIFEEFRRLVEHRPSEGLRVILFLDPPGQHHYHYIRGHDLVAVADVLDHEDGLAASPEILAARLMKGPADKGPVWVSGDGGVLVVHGRMHEFTGGKQKIAVAMLAGAWLDGNPVLPVAQILEEAECGSSVKRLKDLFKGHPTWREVIRESGSNCWLEV